MRLVVRDLLASIQHRADGPTVQIILGGAFAADRQAKDRREKRCLAGCKARVRAKALAKHFRATLRVERTKLFVCLDALVARTFSVCGWRCQFNVSRGGLGEEETFLLWRQV